MTSSQVDIHYNGPVATITLNRPERLNALSTDLVDELWTAVIAVCENGPRAAILTGAGRAFCAGADLAADRSDRARVESRIGRLQDITRLMRGSPFPWIAGVHGYVLGAGVELALSCDLVIAAHNAVIGFPEVEVGLSITGGASRTLIEILGPMKAKELVLLGRRIDAVEAESVGLVNRVCDASQLSAEVRDIADTLASRYPSAVAAAKSLLNEQAALSFEEVLAAESKAVLDLGEAPEASAAAASFLGERPVNGSSSQPHGGPR